jgi:hypothetical protein
MQRGVTFANEENFAKYVHASIIEEVGPRYARLTENNTRLDFIRSHVIPHVKKLLVNEILLINVLDGDISSYFIKDGRGLKYATMTTLWTTANGDSIVDIEEAKNPLLCDIERALKSPWMFAKLESDEDTVARIYHKMLHENIKDGDDYAIGVIKPFEDAIPYITVFTENDFINELTVWVHHQKTLPNYFAERVPEEFRIINHDNAIYRYALLQKLCKEFYAIKKTEKKPKVRYSSSVIRI